MASLNEVEEILLATVDANDRLVVVGRVPLQGLDLAALLKEVDTRFLRQALARTAGEQLHASKLLRMSYRQFRYRLAKYAIAPAPRRSAWRRSQTAKGA